MVKRSRPGAKPKVVMALLNSPYAGCCKPYPDATFVNSDLVRLFAHHKGKLCRGYLEPMSLEEWNAEIDRRATIGSRYGGDDG